MNRFAVSTLNITWGCIQTALGYALFALTLPFVVRIYGYEGSVVVRTKLPIGVSLGVFIILSVRYVEEEVKHEYGHCIQSAKLGPLYLIVVGVISISRAAWSLVRRYLLKHSIRAIINWYYGGYPEKWADRLGGVER